MELSIIVDNGSSISIIENDVDIDTDIDNSKISNVDIDIDNLDPKFVDIDIDNSIIFAHL